MDAREVPKKKKKETEEEVKERERAEILAQLRPEPPTAGRCPCVFHRLHVSCAWHIPATPKVWSVHALRMHLTILLADFDKEWDRDIIGRIVWKDTRGHSKDNSACTCIFDELGELTEKKEDCPVEEVSEEASLQRGKGFGKWRGAPSAFKMSI